MLQMQKNQLQPVLQRRKGGAIRPARADRRRGGLACPVQAQGLQGFRRSSSRALVAAAGP